YLVWANQKKASERHPAQLLSWFRAADRDYGDGASYPKYLINIRKDAVAQLSEQERFLLGDLIEETNLLASFKPTKERQYVQDWKIADVEPFLEQASTGRSFSSGKAAFNDAQCILCHRFGNQGGSVGPELTGASSKYSRKDILESILEPSKVVSDQYQNITVIKTDGDTITGRMVDETSTKLVLQPSPYAADRVEIVKSEIADRRPSKISPMPEGLANLLTRDEILDLLAYIESTGKEEAPNFHVAGSKQ